MIIVPGAGVGLHGDGGNNEVATFTDDRTIQGEAELTFDGTTLDVDGSLVVDGSNISLDSTSTINIDNSNTSNGIGIGTNSSGTPISIGHSTSEVTVNDNLTITGTLAVNGDSITADGDLTINASSNVYIQDNLKPQADATYGLGSSGYGWANLYLTDTGASASEGPTIELRTKSASPADNDQLASIIWYGRNDADQDTIYGKIRVRTVDVSDGTEDGRMDFYTTVNGSNSTIAMYLNQYGDLNINRNLQMNQAATAQDSMVWWDGNEVDFHIGLDDSTNRLVFGTGSTLGSNTAIRIDSSANTTFDGNVIVESSGSSSPTFALKNFNADNTSAYFDWWKVGGSPADSDYLGIQRWIGKNTADEDIVYATMYATSIDVTDSTEDGGLYFQAYANGSNQNHIICAYGGVYLYHNGAQVAQTGSEGLWIGDGGTEDQTIVWNGNAQDYYWGIDDSDDSFRLGLGSTAGTNTVISISTAGITYFTDTSGIYIKDDVPIFFGTGADYKMEYEPSNTRFVLWTNDTNGSGANEDLIRIEDGQKTIDANTTWDDNAFDIYDDAMLLASSISPTANAYDFGKGVFKRGREALIEVGILKEYDDGWIGYNDQRMAALLAGGIYQTRQLVDEMKEEINKLRKQVTALGG